jgi:outer membrane protein assembly factor BamB
MHLHTSEKGKGKYDMPLMQTMLKRLSPWLAAAALLGCAAGSPTPDPTPLKNVTPLVSVVQVWGTQLSAGIGETLRLRGAGNSVAVVSSNGHMRVLNAANGQVQWALDTPDEVVSGAGFDGQVLAAVTARNQLIAAANGQLLWRAQLPARSYTQPLVAGGRVFVLLADQRLSAFDARNGAPLWTQRYSGEPLVLAHPGLLAAAGNALVVGLGERLVIMNPDNGQGLWDVPMAQSRGVDEVERLVDLVSDPALIGSVVCVRAFQASVGCVDMQTRARMWTASSDGATGLSGDSQAVYGTDGVGRVKAWNTAKGAELWSNNDLLYRNLTTPLALGKTLVVGDGQGFMHWLSRDNGKVMARLPTDGSAIVGSPVLVGGTLIAMTAKGGVFAWRPE